MFQVKYRCAFREVWYDDLEFDDWAGAIERGREVARSRRGYPVVIKLTRVDPVTHLGPTDVLWVSERGREETRKHV